MRQIITRGLVSTTCRFAEEVCDTIAVDEDVSEAEIALVRSPSRDVLMAGAVLACIC